MKGHNEPSGVRQGTRIWVPTPTLPASWEGESFPPFTGGSEGGLAAIEDLTPGNHVLGLNRKYYCIRALTITPYKGILIGLTLIQSSAKLWTTPTQLILAKPRPRSLGGQRDWSGISKGHIQRSQKLRKSASPPEKILWTILRNKQTGFKFRRQHPIGPFIADFYSQEAHLIIEIDGAQHYTPEAQTYDHQRDGYLRSLGLDILRIPSVEIIQNLNGVVFTIQDRCRNRIYDPEGSLWFEVGELKPGDRVFHGLDPVGTEIERIEEIVAEEQIYSLVIEGTDVFISENCVLHT